MNLTPARRSMTIKQIVAVDFYAAGLSFLCLLHCLALPLLTSLLPVAGHLSENELIHQALVLLAAPATIWAIWSSAPSAATTWPFIVVAVIGLALLLIAGFVHAAAAYETWLTVVGAACLASAHIWRWSRQLARGNQYTNQPRGEP